MADWSGVRLEPWQEACFWNGVNEDDYLAWARHHGFTDLAEHVYDYWLSLEEGGP